MSIAVTAPGRSRVTRRRRPTRVAIIDSNPVLRLGVRAAIHVVADLVLVAEIGTADVVEPLYRARPDVTLVELSRLRPPLGGAARSRLDLDGAERVIVYAERFDDDSIAFALNRGACGFLPGTATPRDLVQAVHAAVAGEAPADPAAIGAVLRTVAHPTASGARPGGSGPIAQFRLTPREEEVIRLVALGLTDGEAGRRLSIAESTVRYHVRNILRKLGVTRRAHAVYQATRSGLI